MAVARHRAAAALALLGALLAGCSALTPASPAAGSAAAPPAGPSGAQPGAGALDPQSVALLTIARQALQASVMWQVDARVGQPEDGNAFRGQFGRGSQVELLALRGDEVWHVYSDARGRMYYQLTDPYLRRGGYSRSQRQSLERRWIVAPRDVARDARRYQDPTWRAEAFTAVKGGRLEAATQTAVAGRTVWTLRDGGGSTFSVSTETPHRLLQVDGPAPGSVMTFTYDGVTANERPTGVIELPPPDRS